MCSVGMHSKSLIIRQLLGLKKIGQNTGVVSELAQI